jgi:hypothetical protein
MDQLDQEWQEASAKQLNNSSVPFIGLNHELEKVHLLSGIATPCKEETKKEADEESRVISPRVKKPMINENYGNFMSRQKRGEFSSFDERRKMDSLSRCSS